MRLSMNTFLIAILLFLNSSFANAANVEQLLERLEEYLPYPLESVDAPGVPANVVEARLADLVNAIERSKIDKEILKTMLKQVKVVTVNPKSTLEKASLNMGTVISIQEDATAADIIEMLELAEQKLAQRAEGPEQVAKELAHIPALRSALSAFGHAHGGTVKVDRIEFYSMGKTPSLVGDIQKVKGSLTGSLLVNGGAIDLQLKFGPLHRIEPSDREYENAFQFQLLAK